MEICKRDGTVYHRVNAKSGLGILQNERTNRVERKEKLSEMIRLLMITRKVDPQIIDENDAIVIRRIRAHCHFLH